jgi:hypothetical protein
MADVDNLLSGDGAKPTREPLTLIQIFDGSAQARLRGRDNTPQNSFRSIAADVDVRSKSKP